MFHRDQITEQSAFTDRPSYGGGGGNPTANEDGFAQSALVGDQANDDSYDATTLYDQQPQPFYNSPGSANTYQ